MFPTIRSIFINDDKNSFTCVFPSLYSIFSINPFKVLYSKSLKPKNITVGSAATCCGWRFLALTGLPADPYFDMRSVLVRDHAKLTSVTNENENENNQGKDDCIDIFSHAFNQNILSLRITPDFLICGFFNHVEVWQISRSEQIGLIKHGINIHAPLCNSSDFMTFACTGTTPLELSFLQFQLKVDNGNFLDSVNSTNNDVQVCINRTVKAADDPITIVKFSQDNQLLALTCTTGYAIQVLRTDTCSVIAKFKRGRTATVIYSMDFSPNCDFLCAITQKSTLHFFDLRKVLKSHQIQPKPAPVESKFTGIFNDISNPIYETEVEIDVDGVEFNPNIAKKAPRLSNSLMPKSMPSTMQNPVDKVKIGSDKAKFGSEKVFFSKSSYKISLDEFQSISSLTWFEKNQIAIVSHDGKLLLITVDEDNCNEIGREVIFYKNYIQDTLYANA